MGNIRLMGGHQYRPETPSHQTFLTTMQDGRFFNFEAKVWLNVLRGRTKSSSSRCGTGGFKMSTGKNLRDGEGK